MLVEPLLSQHTFIHSHVSGARLATFDCFALYGELCEGSILSPLLGTGPIHYQRRNSNLSKHFRAARGHGVFCTTQPLAAILPATRPLAGLDQLDILLRVHLHRLAANVAVYRQLTWTGFSSPRHSCIPIRVEL